MPRRSSFREWQAVSFGTSNPYIGFSWAALHNSCVSIRSFRMCSKERMPVETAPGWKQLSLAPSQPSVRNYWYLFSSAFVICLPSSIFCLQCMQLVFLAAASPLTAINTLLHFTMFHCHLPSWVPFAYYSLFLVRRGKYVA